MHGGQTNPLVGMKATAIGSSGSRGVAGRGKKGSREVGAVPTEDC